MLRLSLLIVGAEYAVIFTVLLNGRVITPLFVDRGPRMLAPFRCRISGLLDVRQHLIVLLDRRVAGSLESLVWILEE